MQKIFNGHSEKVGITGSASSKCGCWILLVFVLFILAIIIIIPPSTGF